MTKRYREEAAEADSIDLANVLVLLPRGYDTRGGGACSSGRVFECKTCTRQFASFQALGGHRASHKKPRQIIGGRTEIGGKKDKVHECSVCGLEFAMGQALGGHMRRHRPVRDGFVQGKRVLVLDLNFPPSELMEEDEEYRKLGVGLGLVCT